ncbi:nucleoside triphosphate hydrolase [Sphingopyxis sp. XHP0097]|uniref:Nucleoside triphosphate hydrolase n=1 Tax=Sphingopyxis jiangsuensis TaxID=2871171 RepID=A0ABS7M9K6_9SPHN|nr:MULTISPECIES: nucleoside triphosphate hydrolase [Sphingopyxis]MBY4635699.1 nucleoside triphosphate hydrolase [Sphingopyxis jiangsuensis]
MGSDLAPLIAVIGSDGSGKSTLSADLLAHIQKSRPAESGYLGLGSGEQGRRIGRWPLIGPPLHRFLDGIADRLRDPDAPIPGWLAARYALRKSKKRRAKFEQLLARRRAGITIVTDRYPQIEVPGLHDGPILAGRAMTPRLAAMRAEEHALYAEMAAYMPTLVIRLHIDVDTGMARKPDHVRALIARKVETVPLLTMGGAPIVDLDATMPYAEELALAKAAVDQALAARS